MHAAALSEDPSAFDYDGVYDSMVETKAAPVAAARANRSSKYIENLLEKAQSRQREQDIVYERRCEADDLSSRMQDPILEHFK